MNSFHQIKAFYNGVCADTLGQGVRNLLQVRGVGKRVWLIVGVVNDTRQ